MGNSEQTETTSTQKKPIARYEPGELDKTRKNLGEIDKIEAQKMMQRLGGEIGIEKSVQFDPKSMPRKDRVYVSKRVNNGPPNSSSISATTNTQNHKKQTTKIKQLPTLTSKEKNAMEDVLISTSIKTKNNFIISLLNKVLNRED